MEVSLNPLLAERQTDRQTGSGRNVAALHYVRCAGDVAGIGLWKLAIMASAMYMQVCSKEHVQCRAVQYSAA